MLEIYDEYADSSVQELVQTANLIETYAESAMNLIDSMEANEAFRNSYFTEASAEAEAAAQENANKNIFAKIAESIAKIFSKLASVLSKGKTAAKAAKQNSDLKKIGPAVQKFPAVKIKLQDVWSYNKFVEDTIDKHIKKFDKKTTLGLFGKTFGTGRAIDALAKNMSLMASEMRTPSNKKFVINSTGKKIAGVVGNAALSAGAAAVATSRISSGTGNIVGHGTNGGSKFDPVAYDFSPEEKFINGTLSGFNFLKGALIIIGAGGPLATGTAAVITGAFGIAAIAKVFSSCPKKIGVEQVTIQELYKRVSSLNPGKFSSDVANTAATVNKYMQQATTLNAFVQSSDGSKGATAYAQKVSSLLSAYTQFHQALIDFYLSIIVSILKEGGVHSSKKIYKPSEMVKTESTQGVDDYSDDTDEYEESVDDMSEYMDLDTFVENDLSDMAY